MSNFESATFSRSPKDKDHPFLMVSNDLIRDSSISFQCRALIIYLLSHIDRWEITTRQVMEHAKDFMGRDQVRDLFNEAIKAGYMKREKYIKNNLTRYRYLVSEKAEFKKSFRCPDSQGPERQGPENPGALIIPSPIIPSEEVVCAKPPLSGVSGLKAIKKNTQGQEISISQDELCRRAVQDRKDWTPKEIAEIWEVLLNYPGPINDWYRFCEGTIEKMRLDRRFEKQKAYKEKQCQQTPHKKGWTKMTTIADHATRMQLLQKYDLLQN